MIASLFFLVIAVALFFWVLLPFFRDFELIPETRHELDMEDFIKANLNEFSADYEMGKISEEELKEIESSLKKE